MTAQPIAFAGNPLDRASARRKDEAWVAAQRTDPRAVLLPLWRGDVLVEPRGRERRLVRCAMTTLEACGGAAPVLLGLDGAVPVWAADAGALPAAPDLGGAWGSLRHLADALPPDELAIAGQARSLLDWHRRHPYCPRTGAPTVMREGGGKRVHEASGTEHFPRVDPVAIVLPVFGDRVCLGRGPRFPKGVVSAFAGFVEPGETVEEGAARELFEETGLAATALRYKFSQPWPFPSSLMMGFEADVQHDELRLDPEEIEEAQWLTRNEARALLARGELTRAPLRGLSLPPPFAIATKLLEAWAVR